MPPGWFVWQPRWRVVRMTVEFECCTCSKVVSTVWQLRSVQSTKQRTMIPQLKITTSKYTLLQELLQELKNKTWPIMYAHIASHIPNSLHDSIGYVDLRGPAGGRGAAEGLESEPLQCKKWAKMNQTKMWEFLIFMMMLHGQFHTPNHRGYMPTTAMVR